MKIIVWVGNKPNQRALVNKIHAVFPVSAIVTESRSNKSKLTFKIILEKIIEKLFLSSIGKSWIGLKNYYTKLFPVFPDVAILNVENINSDEAYEFTKQYQPDLIIVSGTRLIKEKMLSINPKIGIINLHTGLSPYVKGGPNCTNWCIATAQFHLIGNTIMWIDLGIDSGNILTTEFTTFSGDENLPELHLKVMEHAHDLCIKAITAIQKEQIKNIPQSNITKGKTYFTKDWTIKNKIYLILNIKKFGNYVKSNKIVEDRKHIKTIDL